MEAIIKCAAGLDVHQGSVVACVILGAAGRRPSREVRSFGAMRKDLAALREWLLEKGVTHVGMEGTGIYWQPVHAALEGAFSLIVGNASHMRNVPGRKADVKDAEWIADLVRHGLWCAPASCHPRTSGCCATWFVTARRWSAPWPRNGTARSSCSRAPASSSQG